MFKYNKENSNSVKSNSNITFKGVENKESFNYSTKTKLSFIELVMLFFQSELLYKEYKASFERAFELALNKELKAFKITFVNNNKLQIDNKLENLTFLSFQDLINNYFIKQSNYIKKYAKVNFNNKCFVQVVKHYDITYYNVYILSDKQFKDLKACFQVTSYKYKFNLNKKERKLVAKLKNNYLKGFKYSYNFDYMQELQESIKNLKQEIITLESELKYFEDLYKLNKSLFFDIQEEYIENLQDLKELESKLEDLKALESELTSSTTKKTMLEDYYKNIDLDYKRKSF